MRYFIVLLFFALFSTGCNLFQPRESEEPTKPADWHITTDTAEKCLENLEYAYNFKQNAVNYQSILSEQFEFFFDVQDISDFTLPTKWVRRDEITMLWDAHQATNEYQGMKLVMEKIPTQNDNHGANSVTFYRNYELRVDSLQRNFYGKFQLLVEKESDGRWRITRWQDFRDNNEWTWGRMKNEFS